MNGLLIRAVDMLFRIMEYAILGRVLISWIPISKDSQLVRLLYQVTEPILGPIRSIIQRSALGKI